MSFGADEGVAPDVARFPALAAAVDECMRLHAQMRAEQGSPEERFSWPLYTERVYHALAASFAHWRLAEELVEALGRGDGLAVLHREAYPACGPTTTAELTLCAAAAAEDYYTRRQVPVGARTKTLDMTRRALQEWSFDAQAVVEVAFAIGWHLPSYPVLPLVPAAEQSGPSGRACVLLSTAQGSSFRGGRAYAPDTRLMGGQTDGLVYTVVWAVLNTVLHARAVCVEYNNPGLRDNSWLRSPCAPGLLNVLGHITRATLRRAGDVGDDAGQETISRVYTAMRMLRSRVDSLGVIGSRLTKLFGVLWSIIPRAERARPPTAGPPDLHRFERPDERARLREIHEAERERERLGIRATAAARK